MLKKNRQEISEDTRRMYVCMYVWRFSPTMPVAPVSVHDPVVDRIYKFITNASSDKKLALFKQGFAANSPSSFFDGDGFLFPHV